MRSNRVKQVYTKFDAKHNPPRVGQVRELSRFGSQKVDALGEVVEVDKKKRSFIMRLIAGGN